MKIIYAHISRCAHTTHFIVLMTSGHNKISCVINDIAVYYFKRPYRKYVNLCFRFHDTTSQGTNATYVGLLLTLKKNSSLVSFFFVTARKRIQASTAGFFRLHHRFSLSSFPHCSFWHPWLAPGKRPPTRGRRTPHSPL